MLSALDTTQRVSGRARCSKIVLLQYDMTNKYRCLLFAVFQRVGRSRVHCFDVDMDIVTSEQVIYVACSTGKCQSSTCFQQEIPTKVDVTIVSYSIVHVTYCYTHEGLYLYSTALVAMSTRAVLTS